MKLKLAFNIDGDSAWNSKVYRDLIKDMLKDTSEVEVFLITQNTDTTYVGSIQTELNIDSSHVYQVVSNDNVVTILDQLKINIYLNSDQVLNSLINSEIPFIVDTDNHKVTGCEAILVNALPDIYKLQPKYVTFLQFWIEQFNKTQRSGESC